jgi:hypothetical protein
VDEIEALRSQLAALQGALKKNAAADEVAAADVDEDEDEDEEAAADDADADDEEETEGDDAGDDDEEEEEEADAAADEDAADEAEEADAEADNSAAEEAKEVPPPPPPPQAKAVKAPKAPKEQRQKQPLEQAPANPVASTEGQPAEIVALMEKGYRVAEAEEHLKATQTLAQLAVDLKATNKHRTIKNLKTKIAAVERDQRKLEESVKTREDKLRSSAAKAARVL